MEVAYKINPVEDYLINNGYQLQPRLDIHAKPRYKKGNNEVIVCWHCGFVVINGAMERFWKKGVADTLKLIPV